MVRFCEVAAATVVVREEGDKYVISAKAEVKEGKVTSVQNGSVMDGDTEIANFSAWSEKSTTLNMHNVAAEEQAAVFAAVTAFLAEVRNNTELSVVVA